MSSLGRRGLSRNMLWYSGLLDTEQKERHHVLCINKADVAVHGGLHKDSRFLILIG